MAVDRTIPTSRLKTFFETWLTENRIYGTRVSREGDTQGIGLLAFRCGMNARAINRVINEEVANISFSFVDKVFTNLDCIHYWHMSSEYGGFSDYYQDEVPERVPSTPEQERRRFEENAKRSDRKLARSAA